MSRTVADNLMAVSLNSPVKIFNGCGIYIAVKKPAPRG